jgi:hypothetical protein
VRRRERHRFEAEARRQSLAVAERARDPNSDEAAIMREIDAELDRDDFGGDDNPFGAVSKWGSNADRRAYRRL